jgi:hypothetical protein
VNVVVGGRQVVLTDKDLLGVGGEAAVYLWQGRAVKVYHPPPAGLTRAEQDAARRALERKLAKVQSFPAGLPPEVIVPREPVTDSTGRTVGFTMDVVTGAEGVHRLSQRRWREGVVPNHAVTALFLGMHGVLERIHAAGVFVGDLNDGNVLFRATGCWFIDADSMQFGHHPCVVGHERFLDPRLFGVDLAARPAFDRGSDWYAFAVMLFASLLYVHPFGGIHPRYPTLLRRAEARASVFRAGVTYPKAAVQPAILPDDLLHWLEAVFERDRRDPMPAALIATMRWTRCSCGVEHARDACPACRVAAAVSALPPPPREAVRVHGRCTARRVFATAGRIVAAAVQGTLKYAYQEGGVVRREDGSPVLEQPLVPGMRFAIAGDSTWIGCGRQIVRVAGGRPVDRASTGILGGTPVFDATAAALYVLQDDWLMDAGSGTRIGSIAGGETWFAAGEELGFGFYRAGTLLFPFLFRRGRAGLTDVKLPRADGRIVDAAAAFDDRHVLFSIAVEKDGRRTHAMHLVRDDGRLLASAAGAPDEVRMLANIHGKAVSGGRVVCSTDQGLLALDVDPATGTFVEGKLFADSEAFVAAGDAILPGPGGSVYIVSTKEITQLLLA